MRVLAVLLAVWAGWRWLGFFVGLWRVRRFEGPAKREARRTVVGRGAFNVFWSVVAFFAWTAALDLIPTPALMGFIAGALMVSLCIGVVVAFMQPPERTPETLDVCRLRRRRSAPAAPERDEPPPADG